MKISLFDIVFHRSDLEQIVFSITPKISEICKPCDIAIIFGGFSMIPNRVDEGIKLYQNKKVKKILVTGQKGFFQRSSKTEAELMYEYLIQHGIPKEDILMEDQSKSTIQNVKYSLRLLERKYHIHSLSYILITSDFHLKRCLGLFYHFLGTTENIYGVGAKDSCTDISHWKKTKRGRRIIRREVFLLWYYSKRGLLK